MQSQWCQLGAQRRPNYQLANPIAHPPPSGPDYSIRPDYKVHAPYWIDLGFSRAKDISL